MDRGRDALPRFYDAIHEAQHIGRLSQSEFWGHHTKFQQYNAPDESVIFTFGIDKGKM